ncbi:MAG: hypothetical protein JW852_07945 [Spirochaetales bacterium]|nr:hypothetical protein [Spirochaetales bacterium]
MAWFAQSVQFGRFSAPVWLPASLLALAGTYAAIRWMFRRDKAGQKWAADLVFNAFFIFFIVWKLSPAVFQFSQVVRQPSALLFLTGGTAGIITGAAAAVIYMTVKFLRARARAR